MGSKLIVVQTEKLQEGIDELLRNYDETVGIYISLNKNLENLRKNWESKKINIDKIFFIDCVNSKKFEEDVICISPKDLRQIGNAIINLEKEIKGQKFLIIDALSTLLIYNKENAVAEFIQKITSRSKDNLEFIALSPKTKEEELLTKIFNFFDKVEK